MILVSSCGSLSSEFARLLLRAPRVALLRHVTFADFDRFAPHNAQNQLTAAEGRYKAEVLAELLQPMYPTTALCEPVQNVDVRHYDLVISTADSVAAREFCARRGARTVDVGVDGASFTVRSYSAANALFVDLFARTSFQSCSVAAIKSAPDLIRVCAGQLTDLEQIQRNCLRENAFHGFGSAFSLQEIRRVLRIDTQSACLCAVAATRALDVAVRLLGGQAVPDLIQGTFQGIYFEKETSFQADRQDLQLVRVWRGQVIWWPEMGIRMDVGRFDGYQEYLV